MTDAEAIKQLGIAKVIDVDFRQPADWYFRCPLSNDHKGKCFTELRCDHDRSPETCDVLKGPVLVRRKRWASSVGGT